ncbi:hypothetical protein [Vibrio phage LV6]|nr:hypothetical protein [Vibrio phage LV6]
MSTKFERFINRLDELGITIIDGKDRNDPVALADGIAELLDTVDEYEVGFEKMLLWLVVANDQFSMWEKACDKVNNLNVQKDRELKTLTHNLVAHGKARGESVPKWILNAIPKKYKTVDPAQELAARRAMGAAVKGAKTTKNLSVLPNNVLEYHGTATPLGRAIKEANSDAIKAHVAKRTTDKNYLMQ